MGTTGAVSPEALLTEWCALQVHVHVREPDTPIPELSTLLDEITDRLDSARESATRVAPLRRAHAALLSIKEAQVEQRKIAASGQQSSGASPPGDPAGSGDGSASAVGCCVGGGASRVGDAGPGSRPSGASPASNDAALALAGPDCFDRSGPVTVRNVSARWAPVDAYSDPTATAELACGSLVRFLARDVDDDGDDDGDEEEREDGGGAPAVIALGHARSRFLRALTVSESKALSLPILSSLSSSLRWSQDHARALRTVAELIRTETLALGDDPSMFLRRDGPATRALFAYARSAPGSRFLRECMTPIVAMSGGMPEIAEAFNPRTEGEGDGAGGAAAGDAALADARAATDPVVVVRDLIAMVLDKIFESLVRCSSSIGYAWIGAEGMRAALERWPSLGVPAARELMGGVLFLRVVSPSFVNPEGFDLLPKGYPLDAAARRGMSQVARLLQCFANGTAVSRGPGKGHLAPVDELMESMRPRYRDTLARAFDVCPIDDIAANPFTPPSVTVSTMEVPEASALLAAARVEGRPGALVPHDALPPPDMTIPAASASPASPASPGGGGGGSRGASPNPASRVRSEGGAGGKDAGGEAAQPKRRSLLARIGRSASSSSSNIDAKADAGDGAPWPPLMAPSGPCVFVVRDEEAGISVPPLVSLRLGADTPSEGEDRGIPDRRGADARGTGGDGADSAIDDAGDDYGAVDDGDGDGIGDMDDDVDAIDEDVHVVISALDQGSLWRVSRLRRDNVEGAAMPEDLVAGVPLSLIPDNDAEARAALERISSHPVEKLFVALRRCARRAKLRAEHIEAAVSLRDHLHSLRSVCASRAEKLADEVAMYETTMPALERAMFPPGPFPRTIPDKWFTSRALTRANVIPSDPSFKTPELSGTIEEGGVIRIVVHAGEDAHEIVGSVTEWIERCPREPWRLVDIGGGFIARIPQLVAHVVRKMRS